MKVRVCYTVDADDEYRRALNYRYGKDGLATREELQHHFRMYGTTLDEDMMYEYRESLRKPETIEIR